MHGPSTPRTIAPKDWQEQLAEFRNDLLAHRFDRAEVFLRKSLEEIPYEVINFMDYGSTETIFSMIHLLAHTNLGIASAKWKYYFARLVKNAWNEANDEARWRLICYAALFYKSTPEKPYAPDVCRQYFHDIADAVGVSREDIAKAILIKTGCYIPYQ